MRTLVAGWFSFADGHATAGDLMARNVACAWLARAGHAFDVAAVPPFEGDVDWQQVDPARYTHVVFVCGPFDAGRLELAFVERFAGCRRIGLDVSMAASLQEWNPFDLLRARDCSDHAWPDLAFVAPPAAVPVLGLCLVEAFPGADVERADALLLRLARSRPAAVLPIDTRLDVNAGGLRSPAEVEALVARVDVLLTTRLHGLVLALRNGVPVVAIDVEPAAAKLLTQARRVGWPLAFDVTSVDDATLADALERALSVEARGEARDCAARARREVEGLGDEFVAALRDGRELERAFTARTGRR